MGMQNPDLETKSLIGIVASADLAQAARLMVKKNIGALGVYANDQHNLVGVITERDVTRAVAKGLDAVRTPVSEVMTDSPLVAEGPISRSAAAEMMRSGHVRHIIVRLDGSDRIVSIRDV
jgi:CBS domain-containing protein